MEHLLRNCVKSRQCVSGTDTSYKKVTVTVTMPDNSIYDVSLLLTKRPKS
jgi:hypothetical protein